jgi:endonuclease YncB( thermonuclease family)
MATMRFRWTTRGYVAVGCVVVAVAGAFGFRGESFDAQVVKVVDGDTVHVQGQSGELVLRLWGVDAPEMDQIWGMESKVALGLMCIGEKVHVEVVDVDRYKRRVVTIRLPDGRDVSNEMLRIGAAWWYADYAPRDAVKKGLFEQARVGKIGLFGHPPCEAPWNHRHRR